MSGSHERRYWKSPGELVASAAIQPGPDEFPAGAADAPEGITRRTMLQLVGGSLSLAGLAACRRPVEYIVPYVNAPEDVVPGIPRQYATTMPFGTSALGVLVESHEARPTKIEGNELHPASRGAASAWAQAAVYGLYDPDRARFPSRAGDATAQLAWKDFVDYWKTLHTALAGDQGGGLAVILEPFASPTAVRLVTKLTRRFPRARVVAYAPVGGENVSAGIATATGTAYEPVYHLDQARVILSLDADILLEDRDAVRHARGFAAGRRAAAPGEAMNRLYVVESVLTITGVAADHRLRLQSGRVAAFTTALAAELGMGPASGTATDIDRRWVQAVAGDLKANLGRCAIIAGAHQPAAVHAAVACLNAGLGNVGGTVTYVNAPETMRSSTPALQQLADEMRAGAIKTVVVLGGNPVYDAPADVDLGGALANVANRIRLGSHVDETALACEWRLPEAHFLEAWGDARSVGGPLSVVQPLIAPLFGGKSVIELLALLESGEEVPGYDLVRETWQAALGGDFEPTWKRVLHDGLLAGSEPTPASPLPIDMAPLAALAADPLTAAAPATAESLEIVFRPSAAVYDGRFANNAWLQELPEPISKLTWDNAALLSATTARALGVESGDLVRLVLHERELEAAVMVLPGNADGSLTLALGYGRPAAGRIGTGVGFNAYRLRTSRAAGFDTGLSVQRTGRRHPLAMTSEHWSMEGRVIVQEATVEEYRRQPDLARAHEATLPTVGSPWEERSYAASPQWGMTIDLNACIGCNACIVACQSENNIPVVGKDQVSRGREMQWIRVDRYFSGRPDAPESIVFQPVPCQQCENAPCEQVCPVAATMHDGQGRNVMVYNRCIGTRYCSNNCPYKVRRFNFYNFTRDMPDTLELAQNPNVTVRARGVMEKCTYCVQRANRARIDAKLAGRELADGDVRTACQQTCPTQAIQFGDIRDPGSAVATHKASPRNYPLLPELNTRPRTTYLMRLRNPNPELQES
ncbi:MAG TPA: 4Fe-4S dicluster domain-containing protein [Candidatus Dormibacteraeota bacterium]|nr:4Fe-4S dicluster domain-containing protein [Candidatus Dormibacteraeota bacterium]